MAEIDSVFREGGLKQMAELLTNPARCGIHLSRARIRQIGFDMDLRSGVQSRSRMLENLFREAGTEGRVEELLERIEVETGAWQARYKEWARFCPPAKSAWKDWGGRASQLRRSLRRARKWARKIGDEAPGAGLQPPG